MTEGSVSGANRDLAILLHSGARYELQYKDFSELMDYFTDATIPQFAFETPDGLFVYLQKSAIAAIETSSGEGRLTIHGFNVLGAKTLP